MAPVLEVFEHRSKPRLAARLVRVVAGVKVDYVAGRNPLALRGKSTRERVARMILHDEIFDRAPGLHVEADAALDVLASHHADRCLEAIDGNRQNLESHLRRTVLRVIYQLPQKFAVRPHSLYAGSQHVDQVLPAAQVATRRPILPAARDRLERPLGTLEVAVELERRTGCPQHVVGVGVDHAACVAAVSQL